jgi:paraquat-inducible protein B
MEKDFEIIQEWIARFNANAQFPVSKEDKANVRRISSEQKITVNLNKNCSSCYRDAMAIIIYEFNFQKKMAKEKKEETEPAEVKKEKWVIATPNGLTAFSVNKKNYYISANENPKPPFVYVGEKEIQELIENFASRNKNIANLFRKVKA